MLFHPEMVSIFGGKKVWLCFANSLLLQNFRKKFFIFDGFSVINLKKNSFRRIHSFTVIREVVV